jgi:SAM-dependent methyltransferase
MLTGDKLREQVEPASLGQPKKNCRCPVCGKACLTLLSPTWKRFYNEKMFFLSKNEWFVSCNHCGTIYRYPLAVYDDYRKYGEDYYNQVNPGESVEEHAVWHFEAFQKHNYDSLRTYLNANLPPSAGKRWLDVGSIGYVTSFKEYEFTTIEPDERIVALGRKMFRGGGLRGWFGKGARIYCHTIESYNDSDLFDGVVFHNSFYCLPFPREGLLKASRLLKPDGRLVISISTYFCDAVAVRTDGLLSRIEDVLQGETLWVFHNPKSLEYVCRRAGFELVSSHEAPAYGKKTMRIFLFKKATAVIPDEQLLTDSRNLMAQKLEQLFRSFYEQSAAALREHINEQTFFVGSLPMLYDMVKISPLDKIAGYVVFDNPRPEVEINGVRCLGWDQFCAAVEENSGSFSVVIASYKFQDEIYGHLSQLKDRLSAVYRPNRKSGMESLFFDFAGEVRPNKGVSFECIS